MRLRIGRSLLASVALSLLVTTFVVLLVVARGALSAETLDATNALALPAWLDRLTRHSAVAYPSHMALGTALEKLDLSPAATAVQWLKAAGHVRSDADLDASARGIRAALERDRDGRVLSTVCKLKELGNASQVRAVERSQVPCEHWTPEVALAAAAPTQTRANTSVQITAFVTSATDLTGLVDVEIHDADDEILAQWVFQDQRLDPGRRHAYIVTWAIPPDLPAGEYEVKLGVFQPGWAVLRAWKNRAAIVTVTP